MKTIVKFIAILNDIIRRFNIDKVSKDNDHPIESKQEKPQNNLTISDVIQPSAAKPPDTFENENNKTMRTITLCITIVAVTSFAVIAFAMYVYQK